MSSQRRQPGDWNPDDFDMLDGREVGRIYRMIALLTYRNANAQFYVGLDTLERSRSNSSSVAMT